MAQLRAGRIDFVKDDELQADGPACPFEDCVKAVMQAVNAAAEKSGQKATVASNLTGTIDETRKRHEIVYEHGGTWNMAMPQAYEVAIQGIDIAQYVKDHPALAAALDAF